MARFSLHCVIGPRLGRGAYSRRIVDDRKVEVRYTGVTALIGRIWALSCGGAELAGLSGPRAVLVLAFAAVRPGVVPPSGAG